MPGFRNAQDKFDRRFEGTRLLASPRNARILHGELQFSGQPPPEGRVVVGDFAHQEYHDALEGAYPRLEVRDNFYKQLRVEIAQINALGPHSPPLSLVRGLREEKDRH